MKHIDLRETMPSNFELFMGGDDHVGNSGLTTDGLKKINAMIKSKKNAFLSKGGDQVEAISVTDKRFTLESHGGRHARVDSQINEWRELHDDVLDRLLWVLWGNHEGKLQNLIDIVAGLVKDTRAVNAQGYLVKVAFPGFHLMDWHGSGVISSKSGDEMQRRVNEQISMKRKLRELPGDDCEVSVMHHIHKMRIHPPSSRIDMVSDFNLDTPLQAVRKVAGRIPIDPKRETYRIAEDDRWFASSGALLKAYIEGSSTYAEDRGYRPTELGCIKLTVIKDELKSIEEIIV